jgi:hypothetical protein
VTTDTLPTGSFLVTSIFFGEQFLLGLPAGCSLVASALHFCRVWQTLLGNNQTKECNLARKLEVFLQHLVPKMLQYFFVKNIPLPGIEPA